MTVNFDAIMQELDRQARVRPVYASIFPAPSPFYPPDLESVLFFQYFPVVSHSIDHKVQTTSIPLAPADLHQHIGTASQTISFVAEFSADVDLPGEEMLGVEAASYSVDVVAAVQKILSFSMGGYDADGFRAPDVLVLSVPNLRLGRDRDEVYIEVKSVAPEYGGKFLSGRPRTARVAVTCVETIQGTDSAEQSIRFPDRKDLTRAQAYRYGPTGIRIQ